MRETSELVQLRLLMGENDRDGHRSLYKSLVEMLRREGVAGVSVYRGIMGFGIHHQTHQDSLVRFASELPVTLEVIDTAEVIDRIEPMVARRMRGGLMLRQPVQSIRYQFDRER